MIPELSIPQPSMFDSLDGETGQVDGACFVHVDPGQHHVRPR
jgi:hypothetical protein